MIHNSSSDPVLIKKISLKIWSLRDEIESRIQEKVDAGEMVLEERIMELRGEYTKKSLVPDNVIQLKSAEDLPSDDEDEMAKAMAAAMESDGEDSAAVTPGDGEEPVAEDAENNVVSLNGDAAPAAAATQDAKVITIGIEPPNLSEDKISKGKTILSEIGMEKMFFFSNKAFTEGQSIVIQFCIPKTFIVNADVIYCRPFNIKSRIISQNNYTHRMLIRFNFLKEGERALLRQFIQSIEPDITKVVKKAPTSEEDSGDGDFGELDDLGL